MKNGFPPNGAGRCLCGAVTFEWRASPLWAGHCHCESCRRANSAPYTSFFGVADGAWAWTGVEPKLFESSESVRRWFCGTCGSPMAYAADRFPGETHFFAASMDDPESYRADFQVHVAEKLSWVHLDPDLPSHQEISG